MEGNNQEVKLMGKSTRVIERKQTTSFKIPNYLAEKKLAIQEAITGEMIVEALDDIRKIARDKDEPAMVRLAAWSSWLDRVVGKPTKEIHKESTEMKLTATANLGNVAQYSTEQLEAIEGEIERILHEPRAIEYQGRVSQANP